LDTLSYVINTEFQCGNKTLNVYLIILWFVDRNK